MYFEHSRASMYCKLWRTEQRQIVCKINKLPPLEVPLPAAEIDLIYLLKRFEKMHLKIRK